MKILQHDNHNLKPRAEPPAARPRGTPRPHHRLQALVVRELARRGYAYLLDPSEHPIFVLRVFDRLASDIDPESPAGAAWRYVLSRPPDKFVRWLPSHPRLVRAAVRGARP